MIQYNFNEQTEVSSAKDFVEALNGVNENAVTLSGMPVADIFEFNPTIKVGIYSFDTSNPLEVSELFTIIQNLKTPDDIKTFDTLATKEDYFKYFDADTFYRTLLDQFDEETDITYLKAVVSAMSIEDNPCFHSLGMLSLINIASYDNLSDDVSRFLRDLNSDEITYLLDRKEQPKQEEKTKSSYQKRVLDKCSQEPANIENDINI